MSQFARTLTDAGQDTLRHRAAKSYSFSTRELEKHVRSERYIGVLQVLYDDEYWRGVEAVALDGADIRDSKVCKPLWNLLELNYQYLPVGNAYCEFEAKLIKNASSQDAGRDKTLSRKLRAQTLSHIWPMNMADFTATRKALGHSAKPARKAAAPKVDRSHLEDAMVGGERSDTKFVVQAILDKRTSGRGRSRKTEYQVKWKGDDRLTWEPEENLQTSAEAIERYEAKANKHGKAKCK